VINMREQSQNNNICVNRPTKHQSFYIGQWHISVCDFFKQYNSHIVVSCRSFVLFHIHVLVIVFGLLCGMMSWHVVVIVLDCSPFCMCSYFYKEAVIHWHPRLYYFKMVKIDSWYVIHKQLFTFIHNWLLFILSF